MITHYWIVHHVPESKGSKEFFRVFTSWTVLLMSLYKFQTCSLSSHSAWLTPFRIFSFAEDRLIINDVTLLVQQEAEHYNPTDADWQMEEPGMPIFETGRSWQ